MDDWDSVIATVGPRVGKMFRLLHDHLDIISDPRFRGSITFNFAKDSVTAQIELEDRTYRKDSSA